MYKCGTINSLYSGVCSGTGRTGLFVGGPTGLSVPEEFPLRSHDYTLGWFRLTPRDVGPRGSLGSRRPWHQVGDVNVPGRVLSSLPCFGSRPQKEADSPGSSLRACTTSRPLDRKLDAVNIQRSGIRQEGFNLYFYRKEMF